MAEKEIQLLQKQIQKLSEPAFDLNSWKNTTILVLEKIFGRDSGKISMIQNINYDYSSWTLRDTSGVSASELVKKTGCEILETAINELELFGLPEIDESGQAELSVIRQALEDSLKISQYRDLVLIVNDSGERNQRKKKIAEKLQTFGDETVREILADILSHTTIVDLKI